MSKIDFQKKLEKYQNRREKHERQELRTIRLIAVTVQKIIQNDSKRLNSKDLEDICLKVYNKIDNIKRVRVYNMINSPAIKDKINDKLLDYYIKNGIEPIKESFECVKEAKVVAKTTSDYMMLANHYQKIAERLPAAKATETREYENFSDFKNNIKRGV